MPILPPIPQDETKKPLTRDQWALIRDQVAQQVLSPPAANTEPDPPYQQKEAQRDQLTQKLLDMQNGPSQGEELTSALIHGLSGLGFLAGGQAGSAGVNASRQDWQQREADMRTKNANEFQRGFALLGLTDKELTNMQKARARAAKGADPMALLRAANEATKDTRMAEGRNDAVSEELKKTQLAIAKQKLAQGPKGGKPDFSPVYLDKLWGKELPEELRGDAKVRSALGQMGITKAQVQRAEALTSRIPPTGVSMQDWAEHMSKNPGYLKTLNDEQRVQLMNNITPDQLGELALSYVKTVAGQGGMSDKEIDLILQRSLGRDWAKVKQYSNSFAKGSLGGDVATGEGALANRLWHGIQAEHGVAQKVLWDAAKMHLTGHEDAIHATPNWESKLQRLIGAQYGDDQVNEFVGSASAGRKPTSQMTKEELERELQGH